MMHEWFDNHLTHVCPFKAGKSIIKAEVEWEKKREKVKKKKAVLDFISGVNYGSEKQTFSAELSREYS